MSRNVWGSMNSGSIVPPDLLDIQTLGKSIIAILYNSIIYFVVFFVKGLKLSEMTAIRFAGWISGRIVSLQPDPVSKNCFQMGTGYGSGYPKRFYRYFNDSDFLEKVARCTIIHSLFSEASFQPSVL